MIVKSEKTFRKDTRDVNTNPILSKRLEATILKLMAARTLDDVPGIKHLSGEYLRIRIGDYRLGFRLNKAGEVILQCFAHRREIYRYYPPK